MTRNEARQQIIVAANNQKMRDYLTLPANVQVFEAKGIRPVLYGSRQIQQAVCMVRRRRLATPEVLIAAGYNP